MQYTYCTVEPAVCRLLTAHEFRHVCLQCFERQRLNYCLLSEWSPVLWTASNSSNIWVPSNMPGVAWSLQLAGCLSYRPYHRATSTCALLRVVSSGAPSTGCQQCIYLLALLLGTRCDTSRDSHRGHGVVFRCDIRSSPTPFTPSIHLSGRDVGDSMASTYCIGRLVCSNHPSNTWAFGHHTWKHGKCVSNAYGRKPEVSYEFLEEGSASQYLRYCTLSPVL